MNAENPVRIDPFGVSATGTKDTRLAEHIRPFPDRVAIKTGG